MIPKNRMEDKGDSQNHKVRRSFQILNKPMNEKDPFALAIVGCGRWGINHVRTANTLFKDNLIVVSDSDPRAEEKVKAVSPDIKFTSDFDSVASDSWVNAVIVATPRPTTH